MSDILTWALLLFAVFIFTCISVASDEAEEKRVKDGVRSNRKKS